MFVRLFAPENDNSGGGADLGTVDTSTAEVSRETVQQPVEMEDTIRQTLREISGRTRDESGRFTKAAAAQAEVPVESTEAATSEELGTEETPAAAAPLVDTNPDKIEFTDSQGNKHAVNIAEPPASLRPEAKAAWATAPEALRREFHKRENDFFKGVEQYRTAANFAVSMGREFEPYKALMQSQNWTPQALTKDFMNSHYRLSTGDVSTKAAEIIRVAGLYNLTANDLQAALANVNSAPSTAPAPLPPEFTQMRQEFEQWKQQQAQAEQASIQEQIRKFETDPTKPHFKEVAVTMGRLMQAGEAADMQEAYDKACKLVPSVQAKILAKQQEEQRKTAAEKAAAAKKAASVNVVARGKHPSAAPVGSMEDTIRAEYRRLNGGGA